MILHIAYPCGSFNRLTVYSLIVATGLFFGIRLAASSCYDSPPPPALRRFTALDVGLG